MPTDFGNAWRVSIVIKFCWKATAGGGGRGMRLAKEPDEFVKLLQVMIKPHLITAVYTFILQKCFFC